MVPLRMRARIFCTVTWLCSLSAVVWAPQALAEEPDPDTPPLKLEVKCERISVDDQVELDARARLTVAGLYKAAPSRLRFLCDDDKAWIEWGDPAVPLAVSTNTNLRGLLEDFLDALERQVRAEKTRADKRRQLPPDTGGPPRLGKAKPARLFGPGGAGLRLLREPAEGSISQLIGPRLDIGVGLAKHFTLSVMEGIRSNFDAGDHADAVHLIDVKLGLAYGAPFDGSLFGVQIAGGNEWLYSSSNLVSSAAFELGLRSSLYVGKLALWIGFDGLVRAREIALLDSNVTLGSPSYLLSIGGFWRAIEPLREP
ncbi:MAG: hypothetical protein H6718_22520 [Polyangiaceae bacterium]|nr:hypothetical protein [Myxococcales bacterium]MCB9588200.1 hypothetical protein [Polyangiaceae bacterium]